MRVTQFNLDKIGTTNGMFKLLDVTIKKSERGYERLEWFVKCNDCGKESWKADSNLRKKGGNTCRCQKVPISRKGIKKTPKKLHKIGTVINDYKINSFYYDGTKKRKPKMFEVECLKCGEETEMEMYQLKNKNFKKCLCKLDKEGRNEDYKERETLKRLMLEEKEREKRRQKAIASLPSNVSKSRSQKIVINF